MTSSNDEARKMAESLLADIDAKSNIASKKSEEIISDGKRVLSPIISFIETLTNRFGYLGPTGIFYTDNSERVGQVYEGTVYYSHLSGPMTHLRFRVLETGRIAFTGFSEDVTEGLIRTAFADRRHAEGSFELSVDRSEAGKGLLAAVHTEVTRFIKSIS